MAILKSRTHKERFYDFLLEPVFPTLEGPRDTYRIALWKNDELLFEQTYCVTHYMLGHRDLFRICYQFRNAKSLVDLEASYDIEDCPEFGWPLEPPALCIRDDVTWFEFIMWGGHHIRRLTFALILFLHPDQSTENDDFPLIRSARLLCWPDDIVRFGEELQRELVAAHRQRQVLGIPGPWERKGKD